MKEKLYSECISLATNKVEKIQKAIKEAQDAANNETKSSAGDKHETGRAMAQLETEKLMVQLSEALKLDQVLNKINPKEKHQLVGLGSLVYTNNGTFFISVSLGQIKIGEAVFFAISPVSPIGKLLLTKKEKEAFSFNGKSYVISNID